VVKAGHVLIEDALFLTGGAVALLIAAAAIFRHRQIP